ncbi:transcriptional regulator [Lentzea xinjiangensis]|uniref:transcriptional regulator n=1 Tax=Lentzea xinjiangensis TaxID=402600 RepID=UPI001160C0E8|nr:transcriptional regulator [Lentzea xinjiangensis]
MRTYRTLLEQKIRERPQTFQEFVDFAEAFAREHDEPGSIGLRHLKRLVAGQKSSGEPIGPTLQPATARLLERIFDVGIDVLLSPPQLPEMDERRGPERDTLELAAAFDWLDDRAGWQPGASRSKVRRRLTELDLGRLVDTGVRRARVGRTAVARALVGYYGDSGVYTADVECAEVLTSIVTREDWLDLACPLDGVHDRLTFAEHMGRHGLLSETEASAAVLRLAESVMLAVRFANLPLYRLLDVDLGHRRVQGRVSVVPFVEYALTVDLLERELADAVALGHSTRRMPLRDKYLPSLEAVHDLRGRVCAGGVLALCAIARPQDQGRSEADYVLLVQERSSRVLNAAGRLAVIPKGFHQPLTDFRGEAAVGATIRRELEEELFGRLDVDGTSAEVRSAAPMHPGRWSAPMKWLAGEPGRLRMECTGFGLNLVSGNYEFASLVVIEDEEFWRKFGGQIEANWEATGLRLYSSLDGDLVSELISQETWSNEGLFALLQGLRRLREIGGDRVSLPSVEWKLSK